YGARPVRSGDVLHGADGLAVLAHRERHEVVFVFFLVTGHLVAVPLGDYGRRSRQHRKTILRGRRSLVDRRRRQSALARGDVAARCVGAKRLLGFGTAAAEQERQSKCGKSDEMQPQLHTGLLRAASEFNGWEKAPRESASDSLLR